MVFLLLMELTSSSHTSLAGNLALIGFTLGEILITLFAYLARDWLRLKWIITGFVALILTYLYFVPESPYWLFSKKKYNQLEECLRKIAKINGRSDDEWYPSYKQLIRDPHLAILSSKHKSRTNKELLRQHLPRLSICAFIGFVTMLLYIKIAYGLGAMSNAVNPYWNIIIGAIVEGIGYISASILMTTKLGRKYSLIMYSLLTCICVLIIPFLMKSYPLITIIISQIGKLTISGAVCTTWVYVPEIFPTSMRGVANGVFVFVGRIGAIVAPIIDVAVGDEHIKITFYVYSVLTIIQVITIYFLPETRNRSFHTDEDDEEKDIDNQDVVVIEDQEGKTNTAFHGSTPVLLRNNQVTF
jgi:MFS family permease